MMVCSAVMIITAYTTVSKATVIKFIISQAIFCLIGMRMSAIYYIFLLINDLCTNTYNTRKECLQGLEL